MRREHLHLTVLVLLCLLLQSALSDDTYDHVWLGEPRPARAAGAMGSGDMITVIDYDYAFSDTTQVVSPSSTVAPLPSASSPPSASPTLPPTYDGSGDDTMEVLSPSSTVVSLPSVSSPPSASPTLPPTYDGSGDDTMQVLTPLSTVVSLPSASSSTVVSQSTASLSMVASASSSMVVLLPSASPTPTPMLPDAPSCTLPEDVVSPSTVTGTEEELRQRALCHAACVADQVTINTVVACKISECSKRDRFYGSTNENKCTK